MGIKGLLKSLRHIHKNDNIYMYKNKTFALDMSCYIYKAMYHRNFIGHLSLYVDMLLKVSSHLYLVFDGRSPESKRSECEFREMQRMLYSENKKISQDMIDKIVEKYEKCPKITLIFSPEESDHQLAYLNLKNFAEIIVTEDSDLIVHGCHVVIYKLKPRGDCVVHKKGDITDAFSWDFRIFRYICVLVGCDYMSGGLKGFGFKTAQKIFVGEKFENEMALEELQKFLKHQFALSDECLENIKKASEAFANQHVYDPTTKRVEVFSH